MPLWSASSATTTLKVRFPTHPTTSLQKATRRAKPPPPVPQGPLPAFPLPPPTRATDSFPPPSTPEKGFSECDNDCHPRQLIGIPHTSSPPATPSPLLPSSTCHHAHAPSHLACVGNFIPAWSSTLKSSNSPSSAAFLLKCVSQGVRLPFETSARRSTRSPFRPTPLAFKASDNRLISDMLLNGTIQEVPDSYPLSILPFFSVPKNSSEERRPILDASPLNQLLHPPPSFRLPSPFQLKGPFTKSSVGICIDLKSGYHSVAMHPSASRHLCFQHEGPDGSRRTFSYQRLPMGLSISARIFSLLTQALASSIASRYSITCEAYSDDFFLLFASLDDAISSLPLILSDIRSHGFTIQTKKLRPPRRVTQWLGWSIDCSEGSISIPTKRLRGIRSDLRSLRKHAEHASVRQLAAIVGKLAFLSPIHPSMHIDLMHAHHLIHLSVSAAGWSTRIHIKQKLLCKLETLATQCRSLPPVRLFRPPATQTLFTDASTAGIGAVLYAPASTTPRQSLQHMLSVPASHTEIALLELTAIKEAVNRWSNIMSGKTVLLRCDNQNCLQQLKRKRTGSWRTRRPLRELLWTLHHLRIHLIPSYIPSRLNTESDSLSRYQTPAPRHDVLMSPATKLRLLAELGGTPHALEAFAHESTATSPTYMTATNSNPLKQDALTAPWPTHSVAWCFPPPTLLPSLLHRIMNPLDSPFPPMIIVMPRWLPITRRFLHLRDTSWPMFQLTQEHFLSPLSGLGMRFSAAMICFRTSAFQRELFPSTSRTASCKAPQNPPATPPCFS